MTERLKTSVAVFIIIRNTKAEILLQQRSGTGYLNGYWDFPSGHVEHGETVLDAAVRELKEEVALIVVPADLKLTHIEHFYMNETYISFTFTANAWSGEPIIAETDKCSGLEWFAVDSLPENASMPFAQTK